MIDVLRYWYRILRCHNQVNISLWYELWGGYWGEEWGCYSHRNHHALDVGESLKLWNTFWNQLIVVKSHKSHPGLTNVIQFKCVDNKLSEREDVEQIKQVKAVIERHQLFLPLW